MGRAIKNFITSERARVLLYAIGLAVLTSLPYMAASANEAAVFTGFLFGVEDGNSYIAKMLSGANGDWLFRSPYNAMPQGGALVYLPYLILGKLLGSGATHGQLVFLFHLFRVVSLVSVCFATYDFLGQILASVKLRRLGLVLATLGAGLGWLLVFVGLGRLFGSIPLDFYSPETFGFLANLGIPHLVLARALMFWALLGYLRGHYEPARGWRVGLLWLAIALCHLITAALALGLVILHTAVRWFQLRGASKKRRTALFPQLYICFWAALGVALVAAPNLWFFWQDDYLRIWSGQNQILSPHPLHYLFAYGWLLPFAYFGLRHLLKISPPLGNFALAWLLALPVLIYAPVGLQRRLAEGAFVLLIALALHAFEQGTWAKRQRNLALFSLAFPSTLILLVGAWQTAGAVTPPVFLPRDEVMAFEELRAQSQPGELVLASYETGNALPAWAPLRVLVGHGPEGVDESELLPSIHSFFQGRTSDDFRLELLSRYDVDYVFWGAIEESFGSWQPYEASYLELIASYGQFQVFRVSRDALD